MKAPAFIPLIIDHLTLNHHISFTPEPTHEEINSFIATWKDSGGHERVTGQHFLLKLCQLLDLPEPDEAEVSIC